MLMHLLNKQHTKAPFYGVRKVTAYLHQQGYAVNPKRVWRLLPLMSLKTVYQRPSTSRGNTAHPIYRYLLRGLPIVRCDQVWSTDITYIRLARGFVYLMAVIDWYSRYVLDWSISTTLETVRSSASHAYPPSVGC